MHFMYDSITKEDTKKVSAPKPAVQVHYNSPRPAQLHADAYTRGNQIYLGAGQEHCLPHELGHVLQQQRRAVPITEQINGVGVNTDTHLEQEADRLGAGIGSQTSLNMQASPDTGSGAASSVSASSSAPVQMKMSLPWRDKHPKNPAFARTTRAMRRQQRAKDMAEIEAMRNFGADDSFKPRDDFFVPGQVLDRFSTDEERELMDRISGNMSMRNFSNDYVETPIVPTPRAAPAPVAAATAATTKDDVMNSFLQMDAQWQANRKMPAAYTARYRPKPQAQAPAKLSIGDKIKNLFRKIMG